MKNLTSIEVKCECKIPLHSELIRHLKKLSYSFTKQDFEAQDVPNKEAMLQPLKSRMLFIKIDYHVAVKKVPPQLLTAIKKFFKKDLVGTIKVGEEEITLILL